MSDNTNLTTTEEETNNSPAALSEAPITKATGTVEVREFDAVDDDHPLVQYAGQAAKKTDANGGGEFISEAIYDHDSAWVREWLQNAETACIRAAKLLVRMSDEYDDGWLTLSMWVDAETGDTVIPYDSDQTPLSDFEEGETELQEITVPRPIDEVLQAARSLGYDPTIEWEVYRDERRIITTDNGIGMTPREFYEAFESPFSSGSDVDGNTGGKFGVGSESVRMVYGDEGGAEVESRSRRPGGHEAFRGYTYSGGATAIPGEVDDGFRGTRFLIPVQKSFDLSSLQRWVEEYTEKLRVPMKYDEYDAGANPVDEEYEATSFIDDYDDPPVVIEKPGEYTVVGGPDAVDTGYGSDDEDTFLVSMPIDRNTRFNINTFWTVAIQIHDEQGLIVAGPHRGEYREDVEDGEGLHEDDVVMPEPTGDRDRLGRDSYSKNFFRHIQNVVKSEELERVGEIAEEMKEADHPADVIQGDSAKWTLFRKMVNHYGPYKVTSRRKNFLDFIGDRDELPDFDDKTAKQMYGLFKEISYCRRGAGYSARKGSRSEMKLGAFLAEHGDKTVYMAASTGGKFTHRYKVAENTDNDAECIVINGASKYDTWSDLFGFHVLKEVPLTQSDDHDFDVPDDIHEKNRNKTTGSNGKAEIVEQREMKIRTDGDNSSIDLRRTISRLQSKLSDGKVPGVHDKMVLFPRTSEHNISDHYDLADYAAIASVSKTEYEKLADYNDVMTYSEFKDWSKSGLIATEDGAMTPAELVDDDRMVVVAYRPPSASHDVVKLLGDDFEKLRGLYAEDIRNQVSWTNVLDDYDGGYRGDSESDVDDSDKYDTVFAVADDTVLRRAKWAFDQLDIPSCSITGLKLTRRDPKRTPFRFKRLSQSTSRYRLMADTSNWSDSSDVYDEIGKRDSKIGQMYLGFHDQDIDPSEKTADELRDLIADNS